MPNLIPGVQVALKCMGDQDGPRFLNGNSNCTLWGGEFTRESLD
jgi:hypothetical protein